MSMFVDRHREALDHLRDVARRRAALAGLVFVAVFSAGAAASLALPPLYRAVAVLVVEPGRGDPPLPGELHARLDTISQTVLSRSPLLAQARRFGLYPEVATLGLSDAVVEQMKSDIRLETKTTPDPSGRGALVGLSLSYRGRDPATAAQVSNSLATLYLEQDAHMRSQRYAGRAGLLKQRLNEMRERLDGRAPGPVDRGSTATEGRRSRPAVDANAVERLSFQLRAAREERMRALERREALRKQLAEADPGNQAAARIARLRQDLVQRRQKLTDKHPDVLQLEAEIAALEKEAATASDSTPSDGPAVPRLREALEDTDATLRSMKGDEERLAKELARVEEGLRTAPAPGSDVVREDSAVQEIYGSLLRRYEDAQLADSAEENLASRLKLLDPAVPPLRDAGPPRLRLIFFAVLGAFSAAVTAAALAERLDRSFRSVDDLRAFTRVPVLATVPAISTARDRRRKRLFLGLSLTGAAVGVALLGLGSYQLFAHGYWLTAALERAR